MSDYTRKDKVRDCLSLAVFITIVVAALIRNALRNEKAWQNETQVREVAKP